MLFYDSMQDYHVHTSLCKHASGEMEEYVQAAIANGVTEMCFTEHIPLPGGFDIEHRMELSQLETYFDQIMTLNRKYRQIHILTGIEADYIEGYEEYLESFLGHFKFDLVIMSVHFIPQWEQGQWVFDFEYSVDDIQKKYRDYFKTVVKGIQTGLFDILGHMDIVKRPGLQPMRFNHREVLRVLEVLKEQNMSLELNTSGLRKSVEETYPSMSIINQAVKMEIPIVFGSDAHKPEDVAYGFDEILNRVFQFNNFRLASYTKRKMTWRTLVQPSAQILEI